MGLKDLLKNSIWRLDMFSHPATLRTRKEPVHETLVGGVMSLLVLAVFYYFLYQQLTLMINKMNIEYNQGHDDNVHALSSVSQFPLAIGIEGLDLNVLPRVFRVQLLQEKVVKKKTGPNKTQLTSTPIQLNQCNISDWSHYGTQVEHQFNSFGFDQMLCIEKGQNISLAGYTGSQTFEFLRLRIHPCNNTIDPNCDTAANSDAFMTNFLNLKDFFKVNLYVIDTILAAKDERPVSHVLEKNIFLSFSKTIGTFGHINVGQYVIKTDHSLLPFSNEEVETGSYIERFASNAVSISGDMLINFQIYRSTRSLNIQRTIGKIDTILSYVGGLFSLLFTAMFFFLGSYGQYKYEIYVAETTLRGNDGKVIRADNFGFFTYIAYCLYDWLEAFGVAPSCWKKMKEIHDARLESCQQLDPSVILKRIKHLEDVSKVLISEHRELCLYLTEPMTLKQARRMRQTLIYYDDLMCELRQNDIIEGKEVEEGPIWRKNTVGNESAMNLKKKMEEEQKEAEKERTDEEEKSLMDQLVLDAVQNLQYDRSDVGNKIKQRISQRIRNYIKLSKRYLERYVERTQMERTEMARTEKNVTEKETEKNQTDKNWLEKNFDKTSFEKNSPGIHPGQIDLSNLNKTFNEGGFRQHERNHHEREDRKWTNKGVSFKKVRYDD